MSTSRYLNPSAPGGLLSPQTGDELTSDEELVIQAITAKTYFVHGGRPAATGNPKVWTLASAPNPASSLAVFHGQTGQRMILTDDYILSGTTLTFVEDQDVAPQVDYEFSPV